MPGMTAEEAMPSPGKTCDYKGSIGGGKSKRHASYAGESMNLRGSVGGAVFGGTLQPCSGWITFTEMGLRFWGLAFLG